VEKEFGELPFIAEDLGVITPDVNALREHLQLPGTRVLQFAFDGRNDNPHLPHNYAPNTVTYTGTHDNNTTRGWFEALPADRQSIVWRYLNRPAGESGDAAPALLGLAWSSPATLALAPLQDVLNLEMLAAPAFEHLRDLTEASGRLPRGRATLVSPAA
jgi:4-alpha-glucanotransferase